MPSKRAIQIEHVTKDYPLSGVRAAGGSRWRAGRERQATTESMRRIRALDDVSFDVDAGDVVGIIGRNGAGKSTLLRILSRVVRPDAGRVRINGAIASILEVGIGFHPDLTGTENVLLSGATLGMTRRQIAGKFEEIVEFSELEEFLELPVKKYSTGMQMRLAFSVAIHVDADVLLLDEVLAVGDPAFQQKCSARLRQLATSEGRTILLVSHAMVTVLELCDRVVRLEAGRVLEEGSPETVAEHFMAGISHGSFHWGSRRGTWDLSEHDPTGVLEAVTLLDVGGQPTDEIGPFEAASLLIRVKGLAGLDSGVVQATILTEHGVPIATTNTAWWQKRWEGAIRRSDAPSVRSEREEVLVQLPWFCFTPGRYFLEIQIVDGDATVVKVRTPSPFTILGMSDPNNTPPSALYGAGRVFLPCEWQIRPLGSDDSILKGTSYGAAGS